MNRNTVRRRIRRLYTAQGGKCYYCGTPDMYLRDEVTKKYHNGHKHLRATFDHIIPKESGGKYSMINGVCSCFYCNGQKDNMEINKFIEQYDVSVTRVAFRIKELRPGSKVYGTQKSRAIIKKHINEPISNIIEATNVCSKTWRRKQARIRAQERRAVKFEDRIYFVLYNFMNMFRSIMCV